MQKDRFKIIPAVYVLLIEDSQVLLMRRFQTGYSDGKYSLPAGHLDGGESLIQAAVREVAEEVGVVIDPCDLELVHVMSRPKANDAERVDFFFKAEKWVGIPQIIEPNKCDDLRWTKLDELSKIEMVGSVVQMFEKFKQKVLYSDSHLS